MLNVDLTDVIWKQATLPVSKGGIGVRLASDLALPAFLSSVNSASELTLQLLPARLQAVSSTRDPVYIAANLEWQQRSTVVVPDGSRTGAQKAWDTPLVSRKLEEVISAAQTQVGRARLIAAAAPHSGDFLHAIPRSAVGTRLDDTSLRIAVSLRLGASMRAPHTCVCGAEVDCSGIHGLACRKSAGRHMRHNAVNDLIKRALASADIPYRPCWNQNRCQEMMANVLTAWPHCAAMGKRSLLSLGFYVSGHPGSQSLKPCGRQSWIGG